MLRGVKQCEAEAGLKKRERLPISPDLLRKIKSVWNRMQKIQIRPCCGQLAALGSLFFEGRGDDSLK